METSKVFSTFPSKEISVLKGHHGTVPVVRFTKEGTYCLSGGNDKSIRLWNPTKGSLIQTYSGHGWEVLDIDVVQDNSKIASSGGDKNVFIWDVASGKILKRLRGHSSRVNSCKFNSDASVLVTGSYDKTVKIWDMKSNMFEPIQVLEEANDSVSSINVTSYEIITSSIDGKIRTYDLRSGKLKEDTVGPAITSVKISNDGNCMLCSCLDDTIKLLDRSNGELLNEYKGHKNTSYKVEATLSYDDAFVISGSEDNNVYIWDLVETKLLGKLKSHSGVVCGLAYHPKDHMFVSSSFDGTLRVWK